MQIEISNVTKEIKHKKILDNICLTMESGHSYGFIGDNGSGKTVLFKIILGLMKKTSGTILIDGKEQDDLLQDVGFIIERPNFIPYYTARKNLKVIASYHKKANNARIDEVITMFGLNPEEKLPVGKYSLGMKQKLSLALAFMEDPAILILDEPLSALDADSVALARQLIQNEREKGKLILLASHYSEDIQTMCDVVFEVKSGKIN